MKTAEKQIIFHTPTVSPEDQRIICARPTREGGPNISHEQIGDKQVFHNYGAGGSGWTLSFGCVEESLRQFKEYLAHHPDPPPDVTIIGAGVMGTLTAVMLRGIEGVGSITLVDKDFSESSTSYYAGGLFAPSALNNDAETQAKIDTMTRMSFLRFLEIAVGTHDFLEGGVTLQPYMTDRKRDAGLDNLISAGLLPPAIEISACSSRAGARQMLLKLYHSFCINTTELMQQLRNCALTLGVGMVEAEINQFQDISSPCVFNCAGVGGGRLNNDTKLQPMLGHVILTQRHPPNEMPAIDIAEAKAYAVDVRRIADEVLLPVARRQYNAFCQVLDRFNEPNLLACFFASEAEKALFITMLARMMHDADDDDKRTLLGFYARLIPNILTPETSMYSVTGMYCGASGWKSLGTAYSINGRVGGTFVDPPAAEVAEAFHAASFAAVELRHDELARGTLRFSGHATGRSR